MSTVAVTGSSGKLGRHVVAHLAEHGHRVIALDRVPAPASRAAAFVRVDLTDFGQVTEALTHVDDVHDGIDAVVHLAAIPAPGPHHQRRDLQQQHHRDVQRLRRRPPGRDPQRRVGVQRDRARPAL